jgi:hypothetical protein
MLTSSRRTFNPLYAVMSIPRQVIVGVTLKPPVVLNLTAANYFQQSVCAFPR